MEWDFYGGYKRSLPLDFVARPGRPVLLVSRQYPAGYTKPNTTELYAALTWKWLHRQVQLGA